MNDAPTFAANSIAALLTYPFPIKTVKLDNGIEVAYQEAGKSSTTPLLFIHGLGSYMRGWDKNFDVLSKTQQLWKTITLQFLK